TNVVVSADVATEGTVSFENKATAAAELLLSSTSDYDFTNSKNNSKGVLEFDIKVNSFDKLSGTSDVQPVNVTLKSSDDKTASVDISSAMSAYIGSTDFQKVRVPLSCFDNVDITKVNQPFSLQVVSGINYSVQDIQYIAEADGDKAGAGNLLQCTNTSEVIKDDSLLFSRDMSNTITGWATELPKTNGTSFNGTIPNANPNTTLPDYTDGFAYKFTGYWAKTGKYESTSPVETLSLTMPAAADAKYKDLSYLMENGELQFYLQKHVDVDNPADFASLSLNVQFTTPEAGAEGVPADGYSNSQVHQIDIQTLDASKLYSVNIPLKTLFTATDGKVDPNALQYINALAFTPEGTVVDGVSEINYVGLKYLLGEVKLVMNPGSEGTGQPVVIPVPTP
ncbi:putative glycoside hydrolase, partial [Photobacterium sp. OFAV2-7]|uniref:putative glycoside hydrolase n=1 Tax=Photobacterium sp. OFAV2-7 TaxID=2917748 RepID=UPI001EF4C8EB